MGLESAKNYKKIEFPKSVPNRFSVLGKWFFWPRNGRGIDFGPAVVVRGTNLRAAVSIWGLRYQKLSKITQFAVFALF